MFSWIAWGLSWFPAWTVSWLAGGLLVGGIAAFVWGRLTVPYAGAASIVSPIALLVAAFLFGVGSAQSVQETRDLRDRNEALSTALQTANDRIATERRLREEDAARAKHDAELNQANEEKVNETPPNDNVALPRDAARRVRDVK